MDRPFLTLVAAAVVSGAGTAFVAAETTGPERCPRFVASDIRVVPASFTVAAAETDTVRLTFVGHSTFLIESPAGITIATDYNDGVRPSVVPVIATMNRAHTTHFSFNPDPGIAHVLEGWGEEGAPARHELTVEDVWIRDVTTNIRGGFGVPGELQRDQNSIFVFEVAGLCIAHLGHLHHTLTTDHLKALGRIDVVLVPVDGGYTLNVDDMITVLKEINAPLIVPMHYFGQATLQRFVSRLDEHYDVEVSDAPSVTRASDPPPPCHCARPAGILVSGHGCSPLPGGERSDRARKRSIRVRGLNLLRKCPCPLTRFPGLAPGSRPLPGGERWRRPDATVS